jgi:hypothetical protein
MAIAQELLASVWVVVVLLSRMPVSAIAMFASLILSRANPTRRIARAAIITSLFTSTPSQFNYGLGQVRMTRTTTSIDYAEQSRVTKGKTHFLSSTNVPLRFISSVAGGGKEGRSEKDNCNYDSM